jgi:hypothetical protein
VKLFDLRNLSGKWLHTNCLGPCLNFRDDTGHVITNVVRIKRILLLQISLCRRNFETGVQTGHFTFKFSCASIEEVLLVNWIDVA